MILEIFLWLCPYPGEEGCGGTYDHSGIGCTFFSTDYGIDWNGIKGVVSYV